MKRRKKKKEQEQAEARGGIGTENRLVFYEDGQVFYIPDALGDRAWWQEFFHIADRLDNVETHVHPSEPDIEFALLLDEDGLLMALQLPDPVNDDGAPKEEVLLGLRAFLPEDHVMFLVHYIAQAKEAVWVDNDDS